MNHPREYRSPPPDDSGGMGGGLPNPSTSRTMPPMPDSSSRPLKVLLWSPKGSGLHYGGPGMTAYRLYSKAAPGRFEITLAHGNPEQADYPLFKAQHLIAPLDKLDMLHQWQFVRRGRAWIGAHWHEFDIFHGLQGFHLTVAPAYLAHRLGLPAVVKLAAHQSDLADKGGWKSLLQLPQKRRQLLMNTGGAIAISAAIADELRGYGFPEDKIHRIPNGVDTDQFHPVQADERPALRQQLGWPNPDGPTILFVGQIVPRKRPLLLVEALGWLKRQGINAQLILAGPEDDPAYTAAVRQRAAQLQLTDAVIWAGFTKEVAPLYRAADVFSLPSASEGMPNALLEAMASGLPSVVTPISGTTDLVDDGVTGRLIEPTPPAAAEALGDYLAHPATAAAHGQAARARIEQQFSTAVVLDAHERLFGGMMAGATL